MGQELLILPELPWFIVELGLIVPAPLLLPVVFTNSTINQAGSGRINSSCSIGVIRRVHKLYYKLGSLRRINSSYSINVTRRVHELYYKAGMLRKD
jgi:hypothetical protein